ncbi:MAG: hypothetical protein ABIH20_07010 [Candidatus Diapherotrites archaeon]
MISASGGPKIKPFTKPKTRFIIEKTNDTFVGTPKSALMRKKTAARTARKKKAVFGKKYAKIRTKRVFPPTKRIEFFKDAFGVSVTFKRNVVKIIPRIIPEIKGRS